MDFTVDKYQQLLRGLKCHDEYKLRHDVDLRPEYTLRIAQLERQEGVSSVCYFRAMHFDSHADIIRVIADMGHTIGYHYEDLTTCNGDIAGAFNSFCKNLERLRLLAPVKTACAHGSPRSPWNSQDIWKHYDIRTLGITYEPMLDTDFSHTLYLTDTGRRWDGYRVSVRDKVPAYQEKWIAEGLSFHSTDDIISALAAPSHPIHHHSLLINTHPQRWMPFGPYWLAEATVQQAKNAVKRIVATRRR